MYPLIRFFLELLYLFFIFLRLGLTGFGGPLAHINQMHKLFVLEKEWLDEKTFFDLLSLCQFLPGPVSSEMGFSIGYFRGGLFGAIIAWLGFTLPSALIMMLFGYLSLTYASIFEGYWQHGLIIATLAIVLLALKDLYKKLCPTPLMSFFALLACLIFFRNPTSLTQLQILILGALGGLIFFKREKTIFPFSSLKIPIKIMSIIALILFSTGLALPFIFQDSSQHPFISIFSHFYQIGAFVFGGGHVIFPFLQAHFVQSGLLSADQILTDYGIAQALPGPLYSIVASIGIQITHGVHPLGSALCAVLGIFSPGLLLILIILPLWSFARYYPPINRAMLGLNATVVGLLASAVWQMPWQNSLILWTDYLLFFFCFVILSTKKLSPWLVILLSCLLTEALNL